MSRFRNPVVAALLLVPALMLFPYFRYSQSQSGFGDLVRQLRRPARILVSSGGFGEGSWVAVTSLAEYRPASFVARATKVLAEEGWNGEGYRLLTATPDDVSRRLDELALDTVVLHTPRDQKPQPHHPLLQLTMSNNTAWKPCGRGPDLLAYCRVKRPEVPRQSLRLQVHGWNFEEQIRP